MVVDPILVDDESNYTLFPIKYDTIYEFGKKAQASIWSTEEIDLSEDLNDFKNKLNDNERHYIRSVLAFFAASDGVVLENLVSNFMEDVKIPEAKFAFAVNAFMEAVHSETYSTLIDTLITDVSDKNSAFNAVKDNEAVKKKYEFAKKYMDKSKCSFAERCVAFCCVEGILFSGSFCALYWLKKRGLCPGLTFSNELIARDEGIHTDLGCEIHRTLQPENRCDDEMIKQIIRDAVEVEKNYVCDALPVGLIGMNQDMMVQYIKFVANRLGSELGLTGLVFPAEESKNPFDWMEMISLQGKTNFFEKRVSDYQLAATAGGKRDFVMNEDF